MSVTLTIDGRPVTVPEGTLLVEAARQLGIQIPVFCYHPKLEPVGMCRMCLVTVGQTVVDRETAQVQLDHDGRPAVRWMPKPQTACTLVVTDGMVVVTDSAEVADERQAILEFLLTSHPLDCPVCDKGGECPLQDLTYRHGPGVSRFDLADKHHGAKHAPLGDLIVLDQERCILCARCTRFMAEVARDPVLTIENRGWHAAIVSYSDPPFDSIFSGNTADICPVGALTTRDFRFRARPWELTHTASLCNLCGVGCNTVLDTRRGKIARVMPRQNERVNEMWICDKGRFGHHFHEGFGRLGKPLVRRDGVLVQATWEEALAVVGRRLASIREKDGGPAIGGIAGAHLANEDLYLFQKLMREVISSPNIDHRVGMAAAIQDEIAFTAGLGSGSDLSRVGRDTAIMVLGCELEQEAPLLYLRVAGAARRGAVLISAGGRPTKLEDQASSVLRFRYGTAVFLLMGLMHIILSVDAETGRSMIGNEMAARLPDVNGLRERLADWTPERTSGVTGVPAAQIVAAARTFGSVKNGIIVYGAEAGEGSALQATLTNLALLTGYAGRPNNGVIAVLPSANGRGAADLGILPHRLPGYVPAPDVGKCAREMAAGDVKGLLVAGADPFAGRPRPEELEFLLAQDLFFTETASLADVVLPAAAIGEREGTLTNLERRIQHFSPALPAFGDSLPDWRILCRVAGSLGVEWDYSSSVDVLSEMAQTVPLYAGLEAESLCFPTEVSRPMSHYVFSGMGHLGLDHQVFQWSAVADDPDAELSLLCVQPEPDPAPGPGAVTLVAVRQVYDGGTLLAQNPLLEGRLARPEVALSPEDARLRNLNQGDVATLTCEGRTLTQPVRLDPSLPAGVATMTRNLPGLAVETLLGENRVFGEVVVGKE